MGCMSEISQNKTDFQAGLFAIRETHASKDNGVHTKPQNFTETAAVYMPGLMWRCNMLAFQFTLVLFAAFYSFFVLIMDVFSDLDTVPPLYQHGAIFQWPHGVLHFSYSKI